MSSVSIQDKAFRFGHGAFETLRVEDGKAHFQDEHIASLKEASKVMGLGEIDEESLKEVPGGSGIWRWFHTAQGTETWFSEGLPAMAETYTMELSPVALGSASWEARYKTLSYLSRWQAREESSCDEVLMLNERREIASAGMANVFWHNSKGEFFTPALECGCRQGVVREWFLQKLGNRCEVGVFPAKLMWEMEGVILTNSLIGLLPVSHFNQTELKISDEVRDLVKAFRSAGA